MAGLAGIMSDGFGVIPEKLRISYVRLKTTASHPSMTLSVPRGQFAGVILSD